MAGALRFTTNALVDLEAKIASAADRALALELDAFERLRAGLPRRGRGAARLRRGARRDRRRRGARRTRGQARLDAAASSTPRSPSGSRAGAIRWSRRRSRPRGEPFVANDCDLSGDVADGGRIAVVTGPNMAGKSTYLRQNALIALHRPDGLLRAGGARPYRRRRPAVLARRRGRRSRARPLDLHGRDGRDGGDPQPGDASARSSSSTRSAAARRPSTASRSPTPASST